MAIQYIDQKANDNMNNSTDSMVKEQFDTIVLDPASSEPLYVQLEKAIMDRIQVCQWMPGFRLPTYRKLAEMTGVSLITVQQAVNNLVNRNLLYRRQGQGTFVATQETKSASNRIALFLPNLREPFFSVLAQIIQTEMINDGYAVSIFAMDDGVSQIARAVELMRDHDVDGIITTTASNEETFSQVLRARSWNIPVIIVDGHIPGEEISYVECDNHEGMTLIIDHLVSHGHRRIGFASGPCYTYGLKARMEAFSEIMSKRGIGFNPSCLQISHLDRDEGGWDAAHKLLLLRDPPTAIACSTDMVAAGVLRAARALGIKVPDQLSVVGFDDLYLAAHLEVPLTTIRQPVEKIGKIAKKMILERIRKTSKSVMEFHTLPPKLVMRSSTGPVCEP